MDARQDVEPTTTTPEEDANLRQFAQDMSRAIEQGILQTQTTWRIPLTGITVGWSRYSTASIDHSTRVIEIRIWWQAR